LGQQDELLGETEIASQSTTVAELRRMINELFFQEGMFSLEDANSMPVHCRVGEEAHVLVRDAIPPKTESEDPEILYIRPASPTLSASINGEPNSIQIDAVDRAALATTQAETTSLDSAFGKNTLSNSTTETSVVDRPAEQPSTIMPAERAELLSKLQKRADRGDKSPIAFETGSSAGQGAQQENSDAQPALREEIGGAPTVDSEELALHPVQQPQESPPVSSATQEIAPAQADLPEQVESAAAENSFETATDMAAVSSSG